MAAALASSTSPWRDLPDIVLHHIASFVHANFPDMLRFGAVCRSWRCAALAALAANPRLSRLPTVPLLTFCERPGDGAISRCLYSLTEDTVYHLRVPGELSHWRCWGSSCGWLAMADVLLRAFLFNPISGTRVHLPPLMTLPHVRKLTKRERDDDAHLHFVDPIHGAGRKPHPCTGQGLQSFVPGNLVLSSSPLEPDCIAVGIVNGMSTLAYTRQGDESWVHLPTQFVRYEDVVYHGSRFYAVSSKGETIAIDFGGGGGGPATQPTVELFAPVLFPSGSELRLNTIIYRIFLVALPSSGFLLVVKLVHGVDSFNIFKLQVCNDQEKKWVKQDSIGDCSLFLGPNHSLSLPASFAKGRFKPNCIYFSGRGNGSYMEKPFGSHYFRIYNVANRKFERFPSIDSPWIMPSPVWITPSRR